MGALKVATHRAMAALRRRLAPGEHCGTVVATAALAAAAGGQILRWPARHVR